MWSTARLLRDPWLRGCAVAGALMLAVATIVAISWVLWFAWAYVFLLSVVEVVRPAARDTIHTRFASDVWQTRPDE